MLGGNFSSDLCLCASNFNFGALFLNFYPWLVLAAEATSTSGGMVEFYNELWKLRDKRIDDWPLMSSPWSVSLVMLSMNFS